MDSIVCHFLLLSIFVTRTICKECPPITSTNVDMACESPEKVNVTCKYSIRPGTTANLKCKPLFEYSSATPDPPHRDMNCLEDGTWHPPPFDCVPECGITTLFEYDQIVNGWTTELGIFPWHVGVYYMDWNTGVLEHICGGSLISTELVVSAAHCFYTKDKSSLQGARNYAVAAGKFMRSYYELEDTQQKSQIRRIYVPVDDRGDRDGLRKDIAILRLHKRFHITRFVKPVCVDFSNAYTKEQLHSGQIGKVMGWGIDVTGHPSEKLQGIDLPYIDHNSCQLNAPNGFGVLVTSDKICAGYLNGSSTCYGDSGGGLCFRSESNKRWYLRGIVSSGDFIQEGDITRCNNFYYTAFTNVANYTDWIESVMIDARNPLNKNPCKTDDVHSCILPKPPTGGNFEHELCRGTCTNVPWVRLPMNSVLRYNCDEGYSLQGNSTSICQNAVWSPPPTCIELKCGISPEIHDVTYFVNGEKIYAGDIPWPVMILRRSTDGNVFPVAGTLVKPDLVITNGYQFDAQNYSVVDTFHGSTIHDLRRHQTYYQEHPVKKHRERKREKSTSMDFIVALRLETPFIPKKYVSPLCVDWSLELDIPRVGELGLIVTSKDIYSLYVRHPTRAIGNEECEQLIGPRETPITHDQFCIWLTDDNRWINSGFAVRRNGRWYTAGLVNYAERDKQSRFVAVLTKISYHMDWIKQMEKEL